MFFQPALPIGLFLGRYLPPEICELGGNAGGISQNVGL